MLNTEQNMMTIKTLYVIRHEFARQLIGYKLLELLNTEPGTLLVLSKVHTHSFIGFKIYIKN